MPVPAIIERRDIGTGCWLWEDREPASRTWCLADGEFEKRASVLPAVSAVRIRPRYLAFFCRIGLSALLYLLFVAWFCIILTGVRHVTRGNRPNRHVPGLALEIVVTSSENFGPAAMTARVDKRQNPKDSLDRWLQEVGFSLDPALGCVRNPFGYPRAEDDPALPECFISPFGADPFEELLRPQHTLVIGRPGSGKTALARMLEREIRERGEADAIVFRCAAALAADLDSVKSRVRQNLLYVILDLNDEDSCDIRVVEALLDRTVGAPMLIERPEPGQLRTKLRQALERLTPDELRVLCFDLDVPYDNLRGETKQSRIVSLIEHLEARERIEDLLQQGRVSYPGIPWPAPFRWLLFKFFLPDRFGDVTARYAQFLRLLDPQPGFLAEFLRKRLEWASEGKLASLHQIHSDVDFDPDVRLVQSATTPRRLLEWGQRLFSHRASRWASGLSSLLGADDWQPADMQRPQPPASPAPEPASQQQLARFRLQQLRRGKAALEVVCGIDQIDRKEITLPFSPEQLSLVLKALQSTASGKKADFAPTEWDGLRRLGLTKVSADGVTILAPSIEKVVGQKLYNALGGAFDGRLGTLLGQSGGIPLPLHLHFRPEDTLLIQHPWELLCRSNHEAMVRDRRILLIRHIDFGGPVDHGTHGVPLRVLYVAPRPTGEKDFERSEWDAIPQNVRVQSAPDEFLAHKSVLKRLASASESEPVSVLHFDGHGKTGRLCSTCRRVIPCADEARCPTCHQDLSSIEPCGYLYFEGDDKSSDPVTAEAFRSILTNRGVRLVVLSSCWSATPIGDSVFNSIAPGLLMAGIPAAVGMQFGIQVESAKAFFDAFYQALSRGKCVAEAVAEGRQALTRSAEWYFPTCYLRGKDDMGCFFTSSE